MDELNTHDDDNANVRKSLNESRRVKASADFEARLQRRIAAAAAVPWHRRLWEKLRMQNRIPAFAYSLATVVVLSVASYYVFFRSGAVPRQELPPPSMIGKIEQPAKALETGAERDRIERKEANEVRQAPIEKRKFAEKSSENLRDNREPVTATRESQNAPVSVAAPPGKIEGEAKPAAAQEQMMQKQITVPPAAGGPRAVQQSRKADMSKTAPFYEQRPDARFKDSLRADSLKRIKHIADSLKRAADSLKSIRSKKDD